VQFFIAFLPVVSSPWPLKVQWNTKLESIAFTGAKESELGAKTHFKNSL
jgi:hypothetical protein